MPELGKICPFGGGERILREKGLTMGSPISENLTKNTGSYLIPKGEDEDDKGMSIFGNFAPVYGVAVACHGERPVASWGKGSTSNEDS